jgi:proteasome lid subunit RPN8/RPN11
MKRTKCTSKKQRIYLKKKKDKTCATQLTHNESKSDVSAIHKHLSPSNKDLKSSISTELAAMSVTVDHPRVRYFKSPGSTGIAAIPAFKC